MELAVIRRNLPGWPGAGNESAAADGSRSESS